MPLVGSSPTASAFANVKRKNSPVVQRLRLLAYTQATMVQVHPGLLITQVIHVLAEQPGVLASLSRWRSWVQIPSRTLFHSARYANWQSGEAQTFATCGFDSRPCHLRTSHSTNRVVFLAAVCKAVVNEISEVDDERFKSFTTHSMTCRIERRPVRLSAQDGGPSSRKGGFDSRTGHCPKKGTDPLPGRGPRCERQAVKGLSSFLGHRSHRRDQIDQVVKLADTRRSDRRALRAWEFDSPLGHST